MTTIQHSTQSQAVNIHIDRIRFTADCTHSSTGTIWYLDAPELGHVVPANGASPNMKALKDGGDKAYVRSTQIDSDGVAHALEIECCPPLLFQKHNLFGHCVMQDYVYAILDMVARRIGIDVDPTDRASWLRGGVKVTEVDLTANFGISASTVVQIMDAVDENNRFGKDRPLLTWIKLDRGSKRRSDYHELCIYGKAEELIARFFAANKCQRLGPYQTKLVQEAEKGIRAELKLRSAKLKALDLGYVSRWKDFDVAGLYFELLDTYEVQYSIQRLLTEDELEMLTKAERRAYTLWLEGHSLDDLFSRTTVWKYASSILEKTGINVRGKRRPEKLPDIDLREIFTPENVLPVPAWAFGTEYYFPPAGDGE